MVLGTELMASCMPGRFRASEHYTQPLSILSCQFFYLFLLVVVSGKVENRILSLLYQSTRQERYKFPCVL